jgi:hypothetical protein
MSDLEIVVQAIRDVAGDPKNHRVWSWAQALNLVGDRIDAMNVEREDLEALREERATKALLGNEF